MSLEKEDEFGFGQICFGDMADGFCLLKFFGSLHGGKC